MKGKIITAALAVALASGVVLAQPRWGNQNPPARQATLVAASIPVTAEVKAALLEALAGEDGEYVAYATYDALVKRFGNVEPYQSIRDSEAQHIAALTRQLELRGIAVPANQYLGKVTVPATLTEAARSEVAGEQANVAMYDRLLKVVRADAQLTRVFGNLRGASQDMHLVAFQAAEQAGGSLTAAQMTSLHNECYSARVAVRGNGFGPGRGLGMAQGYGPGQAQRGNFGGRGPGFGGRGPR